MTPLRWLIAIAYVIVSAACFYYWQEIGTFFDFFVGNSIRFLKAVGSVLLAIITLKLGIAFSAVFTALLIIFKVVIGVLISALMPGTLKAIFLPLLFDLVAYIHRKNLMLQRFVTWLLDWSKGQYSSTKGWWRGQHIVDKVLLSTLAFMAVPVLGLVFFYKRFVLPFLVTKLGENFVQRSMKLVWKLLNKTPLMNTLIYKTRLIYVVSKRFVRKKNRQLMRYRNKLPKK